MLFHHYALSELFSIPSGRFHRFGSLQTNGFFVHYDEHIFFYYQIIAARRALNFIDIKKLIRVKLLK